MKEGPSHQKESHDVILSAHLLEGHILHGAMSVREGKVHDTIAAVICTHDVRDHVWLKQCVSLGAIKIIVTPEDLCQKDGQTDFCRIVSREVTVHERIIGAKVDHANLRLPLTLLLNPEAAPTVPAYVPALDSPKRGRCSGTGTGQGAAWG